MIVDRMMKVLQFLSTSVPFKFTASAATYTEVYLAYSDRIARGQTTQAASNWLGRCELYFVIDPRGFWRLMIEKKASSSFRR